MNGEYYTPKHIIDPACGSGASLAQQFREHVYSVPLDCSFEELVSGDLHEDDFGPRVCEECNGTGIATDPADIAACCGCSNCGGRGEIS